MSNSDKISELKTLLTRLVDSRDGYQDAAEHAEQKRHEQMFKDLSAQRNDYALKLQDYLNRQGENIELDGSFLANVHRFFMDIKSKLGDDEELMEAIITGESELLENYRDAIKDADYDTELLTTLQSQYRTIERNLDLFQAKEEAA